MTCLVCCLNIDVSTLPARFVGIILNIYEKITASIVYALAGQGSIFSRLFPSNIFLDFASMPWSVFLLLIKETVPGIRNVRHYASVSSGFFFLNISLSANFEC